MYYYRESAGQLRLRVPGNYRKMKDIYFFKFVLKKDNFFFHDTEFLSGKCCYQERKLFPEH